MSLPTRPDVGDYIQLTSELADVKTDCSDLEYELEKFKAHNVKKAMDAGAKTRAIDYVKVIGNTPADEIYIDGMMKKINSKKREITILYGRIEGWKSNRDLYRTDSYHQVTGRMSLADREEDE